MKFNLVITFTAVFIILCVMKGIFTLIPKQNLKLMRILFPSWRFFEGLSPIPKIFYRTSQNGIYYSEWSPLTQAEPIRNFKKLFHNPSENLALTYQVQIEQLLNDISELSISTSAISIQSLTSYRIVYSYIKEQILLRHSDKYFQFKIGALEFNTTNSLPEWSDSLYSHDCELI